MSAAKILWGQVLAVALIILLSIWSATQWTASALGYQPELGEPWFGLFGQPIYRPYDLFWWWFSYDAYAPMIFDKGGMIAASGSRAFAGPFVVVDREAVAEHNILLDKFARHFQLHNCKANGFTGCLGKAAFSEALFFFFETVNRP